MKNLIFSLSTFLFIISANYAHSQDGYVSLDGKKFQLNGNEWYPMIMNYNIDVRLGLHNTYYVTPRMSYHPAFSSTNQNPWSNSPSAGIDYSSDAILAHLQKIKGMNFNTIRLTGFALSPNTQNELEDYFGREILSVFGSYENYFSHIKSVIDKAECVGLKVILLTGGDGIETASNEYSYYLYQLANYFKNEETILGYDFYNEPYYFQAEPHLSKSNIYDVVKCWNHAIKSASPEHLTTIGVHGFKNTKDWDSNILQVDFLSFHMYQTWDVENIEKHFKWIAETVNEAWVVGEIGTPTMHSGALYDPITDKWVSRGDYNYLRTFISTYMNVAKNAGASGFSLWNYQNFDVSNIETCTDQCYYGLMAVNPYNTFPYPKQWVLMPSSSCNTTNNLEIYGVDKNVGIYSDIASFIQNPYSTSPPTPPNCPSYFDPGGQNTYTVFGTIKNWTGTPIKNAVFEVGNYKRFSNVNGNFTLNVPNFNIPIAAYGYNNVNLQNLTPVSILGNYVFFGDIFLPDLADSHVNSVWVNSGQAHYSSGVKNLHVNNYHVYANNNSAKLEAGTSIVLYPGCEAKKGSVFRAKILPPSNCVAPAQREGQFIFDKTKHREITSEELTTSVYPNPNKGQFKIKINNGGFNSVKIYDMMGKQIYSQNNVSILLNVDISNEPKGIYLIKIDVGNKTFNHKVVFQ
mgnify:CR=1 FL=1